MVHEFSSDSPGGDTQPPESADIWRLMIDVPTHLEQLPDGRESLVIGDPENCKEFNHKQGQNDLGYQETCGLVSCEDILAQLGVQVSENDIVHHAAENRECNLGDLPEMNGGTTIQEQVQILADYGVPAHSEDQQSLEDLASFVEQGHGVIAEVNAGILWNDPKYFDNGTANHAIVITGVAVDPETHALQGFYINDSGTGESGRFVDVDTMKMAWNAPDGSGPGACVETDVVRV